MTYREKRLVKIMPVIRPAICRGEKVKGVSYIFIADILPVATTDAPGVGSLRLCLGAVSTPEDGAPGIFLNISII